MSESEQSSAVGLESLISLELPPSDALDVFIKALALAALVSGGMFCGLEVLGGTAGGLLGAGCGLLILLAFVLPAELHKWRWTSEATQILREQLAHEPATPLRDLLKNPFLFPVLPRRRLLRLLVRAGRSGAVVRVGMRASLRPVTGGPIGVPLEPMPLEEADAGFLELANNVAEVRTGLPGSARRDRPEWLRRFRRARTTGEFRLSSVVLATIYFGLFAFPLRANRLGLAMLVIAICWVIPLGISFLRNRTLLVIPGGIIAGDGRRVFRRDSAVLVWFVPTGTLHLANTRGEWGRFLVTPVEAEMAIRAWLSPVPAPTDEMLAAFQSRGSQTRGC